MAALYRYRTLFLVSCTALLYFGCGSSDSGGGGGGGNAATGNAKVLNGSTSASRFAVAKKRRGSSIAPADGVWRVSPDKVRTTLMSLRWTTEGGSTVSSTLTDCVATYDRSLPSLSTQLECPFKVPAGSYVAVGLSYDTTFHVLINDTTNGLYSDPSSGTKLSTSAPSGGADYIPYTIDYSGGTEFVSEVVDRFPTPLVVTADSTPSISIVMHGLHTWKVNVSGSGAIAEISGDSNAPVTLIPATTAGSAEFYTSQSSALNDPFDGNALSIFFLYVGGIPVYTRITESGTNHITQCRTGTTNMPGYAFNANPAKSPGNPENKVGGFLGLDPSSKLCWVLPTDNSYSAYEMAIQMDHLTNIGDSTTATCKHMATVPDPVSGDDYSSGCPSFVPDQSKVITLRSK